MLCGLLPFQPHSTTTMTDITAASMFTIGKLQEYSSVEQVDAFFKALADSIKLAREGKADNLVHNNDWPTPEKLNLFKEGALMAITLTKRQSGQLRGWIAGPNLLFSKDGSHVDGYGNRGIFDAGGLHDHLLEIAEKHLTRNMRRFEDDKFILWI